MNQHEPNRRSGEQIVNMATNVTVKGVECMTNLAGKGALSLATFLIAALKDEKRVSGKTRMRSFRGKPTRVFVIRQSELKTFTQEAKKYGILYAAILDKRNKDGLCDIVVNAEDAGRVNRIADRFALSTVDVEKTARTLSKPGSLRRSRRISSPTLTNSRSGPTPLLTKPIPLRKRSLTKCWAHPLRPFMSPTKTLRRPGRREVLRPGLHPRPEAIPIRRWTNPRAPPSARRSIKSRPSAAWVKSSRSVSSNSTAPRKRRNPSKKRKDGNAHGNP